MSADFCDYCRFGDCEIDDEECEYDNFDYKSKCHKFRKKLRRGDDDDDDDDGLLGLGLGIAGIALGGLSGGSGGFGGGGFGGGGGGGKF